MASNVRRYQCSAWRKLNPGQQALLVLVHLRKGETFAALAAGFGVGIATAWRDVNQTVALLAAPQPEAGHGTARHLTRIGYLSYAQRNALGARRCKTEGRRYHCAGHNY